MGIWKTGLAMSLIVEAGGLLYVDFVLLLYLFDIFHVKTFFLKKKNTTYVD